MAIGIELLIVILGEVPGVTRPSRVSMPTGETFEIPAGTPITTADRNLLLSRPT